MIRKKKRIAFRPSVSGSQLEERWVPSTAGTVDTPLTTTSAAAVATPLAAPPPVSSPLVIGSATSWTSVRQLRAAYTREIKLSMLDLRNAVADQVQELYADGFAPTAQQMANLAADVQGSVDATALQLSSQAALLPASRARLVSKIQTSLLGAGSKTLSSELSSILDSSGNTGSAQTLQRALGRVIALAPQQLNGQFTNYFSTTPVNQLSVNSSGQHIPVQQYMAQQLVSQLGNTLGSLAQSFPNVATSMLYPNGVTGTPSQALTSEFGTMASNALSTAALQLGSDLSLFNGYSNAASQLQSLLFGSGTGTNTTSLASALQNLQYGSTGVDTSAIANAFNTGFSNLLSPIDSFFGLQSPSNLSLPTTGLTTPFLSQFMGSSFNSGFNNGFATGTNSGFVGFGAAPTTTVFNTNYGTGFNQMVSTITQDVGLGINGTNATNANVGINGGTTGTTGSTGGTTGTSTGTGGSTGTTTGSTGNTGTTTT